MMSTMRFGVAVVLTSALVATSAGAARGQGGGFPYPCDYYRQKAQESRQMAARYAMQPPRSQVPVFGGGGRGAPGMIDSYTAAAQAYRQAAVAYDAKYRECQAAQGRAGVPPSASAPQMPTFSMPDGPAADDIGDRLASALERLPEVNVRAMDSRRERAEAAKDLVRKLGRPSLEDLTDEESPKSTGPLAAISAPPSVPESPPSLTLVEPRRPEALTGPEPPTTPMSLTQIYDGIVDRLAAAPAEEPRTVLGLDVTARDGDAGSLPSTFSDATVNDALTVGVKVADAAERYARAGLSRELSDVIEPFRQIDKGNREVTAAAKDVGRLGAGSVGDTAEGAADLAARAASREQAKEDLRKQGPLMGGAADLLDDAMAGRTSSSTERGEALARLDEDPKEFLKYLPKPISGAVEKYERVEQDARSAWETAQAVGRLGQRGLQFADEAMKPLYRRANALVERVFGPPRSLFSDVDEFKDPRR